MQERKTKMLSENITKLVQYGIETGLTPACEKNYTINLLLDAFKKGFKEATKSWGQDLPDISQRTYDAVVEKFNKWKNGTEETEAAQTQA